MAKKNSGRMVLVAFLLLGAALYGVLVDGIRSLPRLNVSWRLLPAAREAVSRYIAGHPARKLQIGAGTNNLSGWLNTDIDPQGDQVYLDASQPFPAPAGSFDYVFAEQVIEHLDFEEGLGMLRECHRILRKGGKIRLATPNLITLAGLLSPASDEKARRYALLEVQRNNLARIPTPACAALNMQVRAFGHKFIYDPETMRAALAAAGFSGVRMTAVGQSDDPALAGIEAHGGVVGEEINGYITMVFEAVK